MDQRLWLGRILSVLIVALALAAVSFVSMRMRLPHRQAEVEATRQDPRYAAVLDTVQAQHLEMWRLAEAGFPPRHIPFAMSFGAMALGVAFCVGFYSLVHLFLAPLLGRKKPDRLDRS